MVSQVFYKKKTDSFEITGKRANMWSTFCSISPPKECCVRACSMTVRMTHWCEEKVRLFFRSAVALSSISFKQLSWTFCDSCTEFDKMFPQNINKQQKACCR